MPRDLTRPSVCQRCGAAFFPQQGAPGKYCSRACSNVATARPSKYPFPRVCPGCGATHLVTANRKASVYCNGKCAKRHAALTRVGSAHPLWKPKVRLACEVCGAEREVKPSLAGRFRACSKRCAALLADHRRSSLERAMGKAMRAVGLTPQPQTRLGWYVVDFAFPEAKVVVECDGAYWHALPKQQRIDRSKDTFLANRGWRVIRLPEADIKASPEACAERVRAALIVRPPRPEQGPDGS